MGIKYFKYSKSARTFGKHTEIFLENVKEEKKARKLKFVQSQVTVTSKDI